MTELNQESASGWRCHGAMVLAGLVVSASVLSGCSGKDLTSELNGPGFEKAGDHNTDPHFRADTVTLLADRHVQGGGALIKNKKGAYQLITVEHVALGLEGLPYKDKVDGQLVPQPADVLNFHVPGVGIMKMTDRSPDFIGPANSDIEGNIIDRTAVYDIDADEQKKLKEAEKKKRIIVSDTAPISHHVEQSNLYIHYDIYTMPQPETGDNVPMLYLDDLQTERTYNGDTVTLIPLYLLDSGMDAKAGYEKLENEAQRIEIETKENNYGLPPSAPGKVFSLAVEALQTKLLSDVKAGRLKGTEAAKWLPCMGDDGSAVLNSKKQIVGTFSTGNSFSTNDFTPDETTWIGREKEKGNDRYCFYNATVAAAAK